jgi:hypothetical protein
VRKTLSFPRGAIVFGTLLFPAETLLPTQATHIVLDHTSRIGAYIIRIGRLSICACDLCLQISPRNNATRGVCATTLFVHDPMPTCSALYWIADCLTRRVDHDIVACSTICTNINHCAFVVHYVINRREQQSV